MDIKRETFLNFQKNDERAIADIYFAIKNLIFFIVSTYVSNVDDCNDLLNETFIRILEHKSEIYDEKSLKSFATVIARNLAIDFLKKKKPVLYQNMEEDFGEQDSDNEILSILESCLTTKETIVVYYRVVFSCSWKEVESLTGIPNSTARLLYKNGIKKIKRSLSNDGN